MSQWRPIEALLSTPGPFLYTATRTRLTPIEIADRPSRQASGRPTVLSLQHCAARPRSTLTVAN